MGWAIKASVIRERGNGVLLKCKVEEVEYLDWRELWFPSSTILEVNSYDKWVDIMPFMVKKVLAELRAKDKAVLDFVYA